MKRILVMVVLATTACSTVRATSIRMGRMYPAQGSTCDLRFENLTFQEASAKYEQIGLVQLTGTGEAQPQGWEGDTKAQLAPKACEMGGTVVTVNATSGGSNVGFGMGTGMIQFAVWHEKP
jgi:hypothetical protein